MLDEQIRLPLVRIGRAATLPGTDSWLRTWVEGLREALGLPVKGDELLARRFRELGDAALGRFADGYYL